MIVEFMASPAARDDGSGTVTCLLSSLSINSLAVGEFFTAIEHTELAPLVSNGADTSRQLQLPLARLALLMTQIQSWPYDPSEMLRPAFDAVETAVDEAQWRQVDLLVLAY